MYRLNPKKITLLIPVALSFMIEVVQLVTATGICELDDIISNGLGGCIGFFTCFYMRSTCRLKLTQ